MCPYQDIFVSRDISKFYSHLVCVCVCCTCGLQNARDSQSLHKPLKQWQSRPSNGRQNSMFSVHVWLCSSCSIHCLSRMSNRSKRQCSLTKQKTIPQQPKWAACCHLAGQQACHAHVSCEVKGESIRPQSMAEHNVVSVSAFSP